MIRARAAIASILWAALASAQPPSQPVEVEPGQRLGPIRIGMSAEELHALGLPESDEGSRGKRYGPYLVQMDEHGVRRVDVQMRDLGRWRVAGQIFEVGTDIHVLRDRLGDCVWQEGGGEIYLCNRGTLSIRTTHSLRPERYTLSVIRSRE